MSVPIIRVLYAWSTIYGHGGTYELREDAEELENASDLRDSGANLLRLYVNPDGLIVHTEIVPEDSP